MLRLDPEVSQKLIPSTVAVGLSSHDHLLLLIHGLGCHISKWLVNTTLSWPVKRVDCTNYTPGSKTIVRSYVQPLNTTRGKQDKTPRTCPFIFAKKEV